MSVIKPARYIVPP